MDDNAFILGGVSMDLQKVQQYLAISRTCIYELMQQKKFPSKKKENKWYVDWNKMQRWIECEIQRKDMMNNGTKKK